MVKLQESKNRYSITIQKKFVKAKGWEKGQELLVNLNNDGNIEIKEMD